MNPEPTSQALTITDGATDDFRPPQPGEVDFIGPKIPWVDLNPYRDEADALRSLATVETSEASLIELKEASDERVTTKHRLSPRYLRAKERAGQYLAFTLSARGISVGTLEVLEELGSSIQMAAKTARGEEVIAGKKPTIEDMTKAALAVAVGVKNYAEVSETLIKQLKPEVPEKPNGNGHKPRGPSRETPVTAIQAETVHIHQPATNGSHGDDYAQ